MLVAEVDGLKCLPYNAFQLHLWNPMQKKEKKEEDIRAGDFRFSGRLDTETDLTS